MKLTTTGRVWNLSFGRVLDDPISFVVPISLSNFSCDLEVYLANDEAAFKNETALAEHHSPMAKQTLGYNPYLPGVTGRIDVRYPDHPNDVSYSLNEITKDILYRQIASFLSFLQRRRVLFSNLHLDPSLGLMTFPIQAAAEYMDAVAYGEPAIDPKDLPFAIRQYLDWCRQTTTEKKAELLGIIARMSNLLNLPYSYERAEGYWRIVEAIGTKRPDSSTSSSLYDLVKAKIGMQKNSKNLLSAVRTISEVGSVDVYLVAESFSFRNEITHEFIEFDLIGANSAGKVMNYLQEVCEAWVAVTIGIDRRLLKQPRNSEIFGRVI